MDPDAPRFDQRFTVRGATEEDLFVLHQIIEFSCTEEGLHCEFEEPTPCQ